MRHLLTSLLPGGYVHVDTTLVVLILLGLLVGALLLAWLGWKTWKAGPRPRRDLGLFAVLLVAGAGVAANAYPGDADFVVLAVPLLLPAAAMGWRVWKAGSHNQRRAVLGLWVLACAWASATVLREHRLRAAMEAAENAPWEPEPAEAESETP